MALTSLLDINENTTPDEIREAVAAGADPNERSEGGRTPLHYAHDAEQTRALLEAGADPNEHDNKMGATPLHLANYSAGNVDQVKALLAAGADPNACDDGGYTPLHWAFDVDQVKALLAAGADPNACNDGGWTPLHGVGDADWNDHAQLLLEVGADPDACDIERTKVLLAAGADPNACDDWGWTPLHKARGTAQAKVLLDACAEVPKNLNDQKRGFVEEAAAMIQAERQARLLAALAEPDTAADSDGGWAAIRARRARDGGHCRS